MVSLTQLWMPVLLSAVGVFVVSSLIHMVFKWHKGDFLRLPNEDALRTLFKGAEVPPGMYVVPHCADMKQMGSPAMKAKYAEGPVGMLLLRAKGPIDMRASLGQWFLLSVGVACAAAYLASRTLAPGTHYLQVFRLVAIATFLAYGTGSIIAGIWMGQPWRAVVKDLVDAILYAIVSGGAFGWLWPKE